MHQGYTAMPPIGSAEDALFQQKVKALIKTNQDLNAQVQALQQRVADMEQQYGPKGTATHELSCLREENARLRREASLRQAIASSTQTLLPDGNAPINPCVQSANPYANGLTQQVAPQMLQQLPPLPPQQVYQPQSFTQLAQPASAHFNPAIQPHLSRTPINAPAVLFQFFPQG